MNISSPGVKALDIWNVLTAQITMVGSIGVLLDANLADTFYENFGSLLDDSADLVATGDVTGAADVVDGGFTASPTWDTINEYAEFTWEAAAYIKKFRHYGHGSNHADGRFKLQAFIDGVWTDVHTGIVTVLNVWSSWITVATPSAAYRWRLVCTTVDTGTPASLNEIELGGVKIG